MRNFKSFLREDVVGHPLFNISFIFGPDDVNHNVWAGDGETHPVQVFQGWLENEVNTEYDRDDIEAEFVGDEIVVRFPIRNQSEANKNDLQDHIFKIRRILRFNTHQEAENADKYILIHQAIPENLKLEWHTMAIDPWPKRLTSLSGIYKQITTNDILFWNANRITSSVLGLMKVPDIHRISAMDNPSRTCQWYSIIREALRNNLDMLEAKEKLWEAGLKELGKL